MIKVYLKLILIAICGSIISFVGYVGVMLFSQNCNNLSDIKTWIFFIVAWVIMLKPTLNYWTTLIAKIYKP